MIGAGTGSGQLWRGAVVPALRWSAVVVLLVGSGLVVSSSSAAAESGRVDPVLGGPVPVTEVEAPAVDVADLGLDDDGHVWQAPDAIDWPEPGVATVNVSMATRQAEGLPMTVAGSSPVSGGERFAAPEGPESVRVELLDRNAARAVGVDGLLLRVDSASGSGEVELAVDYTGFAGAYGGAWASRLRLVELPGCAETAPQLAACRTVSPVGSVNDTDAGTVTATVRVAGPRPAAAPQVPGRHLPDADVEQVPAGSVYALLADESSEAGDWSATDLEASGSWSHGGSAGDFSYGYPLRVPPAAGPVPNVSLGYSSQSHDGRTSGSNNQASWVGDGWTYQPGFIARTYKPCAKDQDGGNNGTKTGDLCWDGDGPQITLSLNGVNTSLVRDDSSGAWRAASDQGWRVEKLGSTASPSSGTSERWVVTTTDGTQYFFASEASSSSSRWTVPVFGNHAGEPCRASQFKDSSCRQAWRWTVDKIVDTSGNTVRFYYSTETGYYGAAGDDSNRTSYHRSGFLSRIDYGLRGGSAAGRVVFTAGDRCLSDCWNGSDPKPANWPDTPWDRSCDTAPCTEQTAPAFFSAKRLTKVITQVADGGGFRDVDSWQLEHEFKDYGDESQVVMWLKSIQHTGHVGGTETLPKIKFTGDPQPNRVDHNGIPAIWRWRLSAITTETGGIATINYSQRDCGAGDLPGSPHTNGRLCFPAYWTPDFHSEPIMDWFHKYVVDSVVEQETVADGGAVWTFYDYATSGGGTSVLWGWDDADFTDEDHRTYNQWRGYPQVTTRVGDPDDGAQLVSRTRYYRGMDGQPLPGGGTRSVQLTDSEGNTVTDHRALVGATWEEAELLGGSVDSASTYRHWTRKTASRSHDGGDLEAWLTGVKREDVRQRLNSSTWQRTRVTTTFDDRGRPVEVSDRGDTSRSGDEACTRLEYADNTNAWILDAVSRTETVAVTCGTSVSRPEEVVSDARTFFDGSSTHGAAPSRGLPTKQEVLDDWDDGPVYVTVEETGYDAVGRIVETTDPLGHTSTKAYTPSGGGPVTQTVDTNPLGHETTTHLEPAWGEPTAIVDPNDRRTDVTYDPLGRLTQVWLPGLDKGTDPANLVFGYQVNNDKPSVVTTKEINVAGGYVTSTVLLDSLLREIQTQADTPQGGRLITETAYNTRGQVEYASGPNWDETGGPGGTFVRVDQGADHARTWYTYDPLGRTVKEELWSKNVELWETSTAYGGSSLGFLTRTTPPEGGVPTGTVTNGRGEMIEKRDYHGETATGPYDAMSYDYDAKGRLATVTDPAGNSWSYEYDLRGRTVATHDPDAGTSTAVYDNAGRVVAATDARGETVSTVYDELGRTTQRWHGQVGSGELVGDWTYDTRNRGLGLPATASTYVDGYAILTQVGAYDAAGRPTRTRTTIPAIPGLEELAGAYQVTQLFNIDGSVASVLLPAIGGLSREGVVYSYNDMGLPDRVVGDLTSTGDTQVYVDSTMYTAWGELAQRTLGASYQNQVYHTYSYADGTRRLEDFRLSRDAVDATNVAHLSYDYDPAGNILSIADAVEDPPGVPERQCFVYDHLRRLTEAWAQAGVDPCAEEPSTGAMGGPAPYWSSYEFDVTGNRLSETRHDPGGGSQTSVYDYPGHGGLQPHTLSSVTTGSQVDTYSYDSAGNLTSRTVDGRTETIDWDASGKPVAVTDQDSGDVTRMVYNQDGDRIARIDGNGDAHLFLAGHEISYTAASGAVTAVRSYEHNGDVIATRSTDDGLQWLASDHHGTAAWAIAAISMAVTYRRQDPYGNPRGTSGAWPGGQEGFVRGIEDPTGLVHIGARSYDPTIGRFISSDPITDLSDLQQINGYSYANANPVTWSDPTGLIVLGDNEGKLRAKPKPGGGHSVQKRTSQSPANPGRGTISKLSRFVAGAKAGWDNYAQDRAKGIVEFLEDPWGSIKHAAQDFAENATKWTARSGNQQAGVGCALTGACDIGDKLGQGDYYGAGYDTGSLFGDLLMGGAGTGGIGAAVTALIRTAATMARSLSATIRSGTLVRSNRPLAIAASTRVAPWAGNTLSRVTMTSETMYRVWGGESGRVGEWLTPIRPTSSAVARAGLALPEGNAAIYASRVVVPAGTRIQVGTAGSAFGQPGGWVQVQLLERIPVGSFEKGVFLRP